LGSEANIWSFMSAARDLFLEVSRTLAPPGNEVAYEKLYQAAELWRRDGQHFSAGVAMSCAIDAAWGNPDHMLKAQHAGLLDFEQVISEQSPDAPVSLAALYKLKQLLARSLWLFKVDCEAIQTRIREINSELAQRLLKHFGNSEHASNYLVRGIVIVTDLDGKWDVQFPAYEVPMDVEQRGQELILNIPSAFHLFTFDGDWQGAHKIVLEHAIDFTTPGLKGWLAVTLAHVEKAKAVAWFDKAADAFAADTLPVALEEKGGH